MDLHEKSLRVGAAAVVCALLLRLFAAGMPQQLLTQLANPENLALLLYLETGQVLRLGLRETQPTLPSETQPPRETEPAPVLPVFAQEDAALVGVNSVCGYEADVAALLQQPLRWDLTAEGPTVLILHTHGTESYTKTEDYEESSAYRTLDPGYNVVSVGARIAQVLEAGGIEVIHDTALHDEPSFVDAYNQSRASAERYLAQYPSIRIILDIHRDSAEDSQGNQFGPTVEVDGEKAAKVMMVVGTDVNLAHPAWRENMALAVKLHAQLEKTTPGLCRDISFRKQRFNQDLSTGAMLIEMGAAGNTRQEALLAAELLARGILALAHGTGDTLA